MISSSALKSLVSLVIRKALPLLKIIVGVVVQISLYVIILCGVLILSLKAPEMHNYYLRNKVGQKVYTIKDSVNSSGGTGFAVEAPSGKSFIVTNDHVCGLSVDHKTLLVIDEGGEMQRRNIIAHDPLSDLCLIEGIQGIVGLTVAGKEPSLGEKIYAVGHPSLLPLAINSGEMIGYEDTNISQGIIAMWDKPLFKWIQIEPGKKVVSYFDCLLPKHRIRFVYIDISVDKIDTSWCEYTVTNNYITTITILPGNSGSPTVNTIGNVNGVVFATDLDKWGRIISLSDLKRFLKNY